MSLIRYTKTSKWNDPWFRRLSPEGKVTFLYLCDNCDLAGFIEIDIELIAFRTRVRDVEFSLKEIEKSYYRHDSWVWMKRFLHHQENLPLDKKNKAHIKVARLLLDKWKIFGSQVSQTIGHTERELSMIYRTSKLKKRDTSPIHGGSMGDLSPPVLSCLVMSDNSKAIYKEIISYWGSKESLPEIRAFGKERIRTLKARLKDKFFVSNWRAAVDRLSQSSFHTGDNDRGWSADIDWFLKPANFTKIMEWKTNGKSEVDDLVERSKQAAKEYARG